MIHQIYNNNILVFSCDSLSGCDQQSLAFKNLSYKCNSWTRQYGTQNIGISCYYNFSRIVTTNRRNEPICLSSQFVCFFCSGITAKKVLPLYDRDIICADLETIIVDNKHKVYGIAFIDFLSIGLSHRNSNVIYSEKYECFLYDLNDLETESIETVQNKLMFECFKSWLKRFEKLDKNSSSKPQLYKKGSKSPLLVYFHNLNFDGSFVLKFLLKTNLLQTWCKNYYGIEDLEVRIRRRDNKLLFIDLCYSYTSTETNKIKVVTIMKFVDSYKMLPFSLEKLGHSFLNRGKLQFDHSIVNLDWLKSNENRNLCMKYLKSDVYLLKEIVEKSRTLFFQECGVDVCRHITIAGLTLDTFRTKFLRSEIDLYKHLGVKEELLIPLRGGASTFIREAYMGGRSEIFRPFFRKTDNNDYLYVYDVNSLYPSVMVTDLPIGKPTRELNCSKIEIKSHGFYKVMVYVSPEVFPTLPIRHKIGGSDKLIYPNGTFEGIWYGAELLFARDQGTVITEVLDAWVFKTAKPILANFIDYYYNLRLNAKKKGDIVRSTVYKLILNTLYGRLGMREEITYSFFVKTLKEALFIFEYYDCDIVELNDLYMVTIWSKEEEFNESDFVNIWGELEGKKKSFYKRIPFMKQLVNQGTTPFEKLSTKDQKELLYISRRLSGQLSTIKKNVVTHIAAAITAKARIEHHKMLLKYRDHLYYADTDSIFIDCQMDSDFVSATDLGKYKLEHVAKEAYFIAPKTYALLPRDDSLDPVIKSKGSLGVSGTLSFHTFRQAYLNVTPSGSKPLGKKVSIYRPINICLRDFEVRSQYLWFDNILNITSKREAIFGADGRWCDTKPYTLSESIGDKLLGPSQGKFFFGKRID